MSVESLLIERERLLAEVAAIDVELASHGIRAEARASRVRTVALRVLASLEGGPRHLREIMKATSQSMSATNQMLYLMVRSGEVRRVERGVYALSRKKRR